MMEEKLKDLVLKAIKGPFPKIAVSDCEIEIPKGKNFGDFSTSVAFALIKAVKKSPQEIAQKIIQNLPKNELIERVEAKSGFINFWLKKEWLQKQVNAILKEKERYGQSDFGNGQKIQVEFISANPTGPLTLGNGRGGFYGDVLSRVLERAGYKVEREYYVNDTGNQIKALGESVLKLKKDNLYKGKYIEDLSKRIKETEPQKAGEEAAKIILEESIKKDIASFGIKFDSFVSEKEILKKGETEKVIKKLKEKKLTYEKEGALWFSSKKFGDDEDRVLKRKDGQFTYFATDTANHLRKFKKVDKVVNFWGADHFGYVRRLLAALSVFGLDKKLKIIVMQLVRLVEGGRAVKMSKRAGTYVALRQLVDNVKLDVVRYFFISVVPDTHMDFDLKLAKERSVKNPVYYIQYASARMHGILAKLKIKNEKLKITDKNSKLLNDAAEIGLIKQLIRYPDLIEEIAHNYQVHKLPHYAYELATAFHNFYEKCPVINQDKQLSDARLNLVLASKIVLENSLTLMGIKAPKKM